MKALQALIRRGGTGTHDEPEVLSILAFNSGCQLHKQLIERNPRIIGESFVLVSKHALPPTGLHHNLAFVHAPAVPNVPKNAALVNNARRSLPTLPCAEECGSGEQRSPCAPYPSMCRRMRLW